MAIIIRVRKAALGLQAGFKTQQLYFVEVELGSTGQPRAAVPNPGITTPQS